ncbi:DNA-binding protein Alba [archaeon]|nr:DNA-binding protein Alba [archaeon]
MTKEKTKKSKKDGNIFIGNKMFMNYVTGVVMQINSGVKDVSIKARGKYISKAVDVAEVVRNRFLQDVKVKGIKIGSDEFEGRQGKNIRVSTIDITLTK